jgi:hypothetical protein
MNRALLNLLRASLPIAVLLGLASSLAHADGIRTERVQFAKGASSAIVEGSIKGYETVDYVVRASQGQSMNVSLATQHTATYFNLLAPGQTEVAFFNGSVSENQYEGTLPATGDYKIRVYMMRSAARRDESAKYRLEIAISGAAHGAVSHDAKVAGTGYHATAKIRCVAEPDKPMTSCDAGVKRVAW